MDPTSLPGSWRPRWAVPAGAIPPQHSCDHPLFIAAATASRRSPALQTRETVSRANLAGTGLGATSPAHLAPLARAVGSSVPTAGLGRPVSQTVATANTVTLAGRGPGKRVASVWGEVCEYTPPAVTRWMWEIPSQLLCLESCLPPLQSTRSFADWL